MLVQYEFAGAAGCRIRPPIRRNVMVWPELDCCWSLWNQSPDTCSRIYEVSCSTLHSQRNLDQPNRISGLDIGIDKNQSDANLKQFYIKKSQRELRKEGDEDEGRRGETREEGGRGIRAS
jgi:hypothetical protein